MITNTQIINVEIILQTKNKPAGQFTFDECGKYFTRISNLPKSLKTPTKKMHVFIKDFPYSAIDWEFPDSDPLLLSNIILLNFLKAEVFHRHFFGHAHFC